MGAYMSEPHTDKVSEDFRNGKVLVGASSMQGWRISQEDAHNAILDYDGEDTSFFAVYDGHGGHEVAVYTAQKLPEYIRQNGSYKEGNIEKALVDSFVSFDATLVDRQVVAELKIIAGNSKDEDDEDHDPNEVDNLYKEATMSIEEVIAQYEEGEEAVQEPKNPAIVKVGESSSLSKKHPISPFLRAKRSRLVKESSLSSGSGSGSAGKSEISVSTDVTKESREGAAKEETGAKVETAKSDVTQVPAKDDSTTHEPDEEKPKSQQMSKCDSDNQVDIKPQDKTEDSDVKAGWRSDAGPANKNEGPQLVNGHVNGESVVPRDDADVKVTENGTESPTGKGKGKGKGKSNTILRKRAAENTEENESTTDAPTPCKRVKRSASQLYQEMLSTEADYDEDSDEDDDNFENAVASSSEEDDEEEDMEEADTEELEEDEDEDEESDTGDDEEEEGDADEGEYIGGAFNEEPGNDSGCTAVVAILHGSDLYVANAGDSRCVVCRDGKAIDMSFDHKPEDEPEMQRIQKAGGKVTPDGRVNGGLNLSRAIGDHAYKTNKSLPLQEQMISPVPDVRTLTVNPETDSFMVLACDGIWNSMSSQEVVDFVAQRINKEQKVSSICEELFDRCLAPDTMGDGTGCDNMTAVVVKFQNVVDPNPNSNTVSDVKTATTSSEKVASSVLAEPATSSSSSGSLQADSLKTKSEEASSHADTAAE